MVKVRIQKYYDYTQPAANFVIAIITDVDVDYEVYIHTFRLAVPDNTELQTDIAYFVYKQWIHKLEADISSFMKSHQVGKTCVEATNQFSKLMDEGKHLYNEAAAITVIDNHYSLGNFLDADEPELSESSRKLPGIYKEAVSPCGCLFAGLATTVREIIMHLNDRCLWSREKIADWLDDLQDNHGYNFEFQPWAEEEEML